jgi:2,4-dienoyl-CoA reductase-like NADH-dependent reductase (Old Yellow Enzyme family)
MALFSPLSLRGVTFPNRIAVSPMSQYAAKDGYASDYHFAHLARFALGGAGLVLTEATAVEERGRRTPGDLGLWQDGQIDGLARIASFVASEGAVPGIQLGHAGRKASERRPWHGQTPLNDEDATQRNEAPWPAIGPTGEPYGDGWPAPRAMEIGDIEDVRASFRAAAARAREAGFRVIEVYAAHGFLLHQFYSPACNTRSDAYGGDLESRIRLLLEVASDIRSEWPDDLPLLFRISAVDWVEAGWELEDTVALARALKQSGVDMLVCSSGAIGGTAAPIRMPVAAGFQVPFAQAVRSEADLASMAVGFIWDPHFADALVSDGRADMVALARELLNNPNWPLHAARALGVDDDYGRWKPQFGWWLNKRERLIKKLGLRGGG